MPKSNSCVALNIFLIFVLTIVIALIDYFMIIITWEIICESFRIRALQGQVEKAPFEPGPLRNY